MEIPLLVMTAVFAIGTAMVWRSRPIVARVLLGVATAYAFAGLQHPGLSAQEVVDTGSTAMAVLVTFARIAGTGAAVIAITLTVRDRTA